MSDILQGDDSVMRKCLAMQRAKTEPLISAVAHGDIKVTFPATRLEVERDPNRGQRVVQIINNFEAEPAREMPQTSGWRWPAGTWLNGTPPANIEIGTLPGGMELTINGTNWHFKNIREHRHYTVIVENATPELLQAWWDGAVSYCAGQCHCRAPIKFGSCTNICARCSQPFEKSKAPPPLTKTPWNSLCVTPEGERVTLTPEGERVVEESFSATKHDILTERLRAEITRLFREEQIEMSPETRQWCADKVNEWMRQGAGIGMKSPPNAEDKRTDDQG